MTASSTPADAARRALAHRVLGLIDLTDLGTASTDDDVAALCHAAHTAHGDVAAVCIWPRSVARARRELGDRGIRIATVVNFPSGDEPQPLVCDQTRRAVADGADEIDVVIPYRRLLAGDRAATTSMVAAVVEAAGAARVKAILETGELHSDAVIADAARAAIDAGAHFIKTSTGKTPISATPEAVRTMLEVIADAARPVGIKPSGGIRTLDDAAAYVAMAEQVMGQGWVDAETFRIGASSLLGAVLTALG